MVKVISTATNHKFLRKIAMRKAMFYALCDIAGPAINLNKRDMVTIRKLLDACWIDTYMVAEWAGAINGDTFIVDWDKWDLANRIEIKTVTARHHGTGSKQISARVSGLATKEGPLAVVVQTADLSRHFFFNIPYARYANKKLDAKDGGSIELNLPFKRDGVTPDKYGRKGKYKNNDWQYEVLIENWATSSEAELLEFEAQRGEFGYGLSDSATKYFT